MSDSISFDLLVFRPATAARITGVSVESQRDWRRRGLIARQASASGALHVADLTLLALFSTFSDLLGGPSAAATAARAFAAPILWRVLAADRAWIDGEGGAARATNVCAALGLATPPAGRFGGVAGDIVLIAESVQSLIDDLAERGAVVINLDQFAARLLDEIGAPVAAPATVPELSLRNRPSQPEKDLLQ
ncbi:MAG: hypothetical protein R3C58_14140 [Parvularculaceae bacterium]